MENIEYKGYTIVVSPDYDAENPRDDDNLGTMACAHGRYQLGDEQVDPQTWQPPKNAVCVMPLWLYDHSGLSLRTAPHGQHVAWDCGKVGYIYTTKSRINKWFGTKKCDEDLLERARGSLIAEIEIYSMYLGGDVWCMRVLDPQGDEVDSGCGFGYSEMMEDAENAVDHDIERNTQ